MLFLISLWFAAVVALRPINLRTEYLQNNVFIETLVPRFSWTYNSSGLPTASRGLSQTFYNLTVTNAISNTTIWATGLIASNQSSQIEYAGTHLISDQIYRWAVCSIFSDGSQGCSQAATFATALLSPADWLDAAWIGQGFGQVSGLLKLASTASPVRATLFVAGAGFVEASVNGVRVSDAVLDPAWSVFETRVLYSAFDVSSLITTNDPINVHLLLGGGWFNKSYGFHTAQAPCVRAVLRVLLADGTLAALVTDGSWLGAQGPVTSSDIYNGETYDARLELDPANPAALFAQPSELNSNLHSLTHLSNTWQKLEVNSPFVGVSSLMILPPERPVATRALVQPDPSMDVFDVTQGISGWVRVSMCGLAAGQKVRVRYAELLDAAGLLNRGSLRGAQQEDVYISQGEACFQWEPKFTYHGFRYVEVLTSVPGQRVKASELLAVVVHTDTPPAGSFGSSEPNAADPFAKDVLDKIHAMCWWTQRTNLHGLPTACNQRDERTAWLADAFASMEQAMYNFDMAAFYTKFLNDIRDSQVRNFMQRSIMQCNLLWYAGPFHGRGAGRGAFRGRPLSWGPALDADVPRAGVSNVVELWRHSRGALSLPEPAAVCGPTQIADLRLGCLDVWFLRRLDRQQANLHRLHQYLCLLLLDRHHAAACDTAGLVCRRQHVLGLAGANCRRLRTCFFPQRLFRQSRPRKRAMVRWRHPDRELNGLFRFPGPGRPTCERA